MTNEASPPPADAEVGGASAPSAPAAEVGGDDGASVRTSGSGQSAGYLAFLNILSAPTVEVAADDDGGDDDGVSELDGGGDPTTHSHSAFLEYLKAPSPTGASGTEGFRDDGGGEAASEPRKRSGCEAVGDRVDEGIYGAFYKVGTFCSRRPKSVIAVSALVAILCAMGFAKVNNENRPEKVRMISIDTLCAVSAAVKLHEGGY